MWPRHTIDMGIDLGTSKFSVCVKGEGVVASEPAYLAFQGESLTPASIVAIGHQAESLLGRCPQGLQVICPMRDGIIIHPYAASLLLNKMTQPLRLSLRLHKRRALVGALFGASSIEAKAFVEVASSLGTSTTKAVFEPLAAAIGCLLPIDEPHARMLVDIGSGVTEIVLVALGHVVVGRSLRIGGDAMDAALVRHFSQKHNLLIGFHTARALKEGLSSLSSTTDVCVKGTFRPSRSPHSVTVPRQELCDAIRPIIQAITNFVASVLEDLEPEMAVDLIETGILLSGGGALCAGVAESIATATGLAVTTTTEPRAAVVRGCHRMLTHFDLVS